MATRKKRLKMQLINNRRDRAISGMAEAIEKIVETIETVTTEPVVEPETVAVVEEPVLKAVPKKTTTAKKTTTTAKKTRTRKTRTKKTGA